MKISDWNLERRWTRNWDVGMGRISQVEGHHFLLILHLLFMLSFYRTTVGVRETFESIEANLLWSEDKNKNK
jgi:hypothetical protein